MPSALIKRIVDGQMLGTTSTSFSDLLTDETLTLCALIDILRTDGVQLAFTTHDEQFLLSGTNDPFEDVSGLTYPITYQPLDSVSASAIRQELGSGIDNLDVIGILSSDAITETDLRAGRYDSAQIRVLLANYEEPAASAGDTTRSIMLILRGITGQVTLVDGHYTVEIRSQMQKFTQQIGRVFSPLCDVKEFGDARCGFDRTTVQFSFTLVSIDSTLQFHMSGTHDTATAYYSSGRMIATSGANDGLAREIKSHTVDGSDAVIILQRAFPFDFDLADTITLEGGCDRTIGVCHNSFSNAVNFRGFPQMPGNDQLMKTGRPPESQ
jgi:uncharacterized phage protein (TIGR02218 family)